MPVTAQSAQSRDWLRVADVLREFGGAVGRNTLYAALRRGETPHVRIGRVILIHRDALRRWAGLDAETQ